MKGMNKENIKKYMNRKQKDVSLALSRQNTHSLSFIFLLEHLEKYSDTL
jgi:hypothetical protein